MKRFVISLCLLMTSVMGQAQHRTYLDTGPFAREDMYITQTEGGEHLMFVQFTNWNNLRDSVFIALNEKESKALKRALKEMNETYCQWSSAAHRHRVKSYSRPMDIELPGVVFQWKATKDVFGKELYERDYTQTSATYLPKPLFTVDPEGRCGVEIAATLCNKDDNANRYELLLFFPSSATIRRAIKRCDTNWAISKYKKLNRNRTEAFYDSIFK